MHRASSMHTFTSINIAELDTVTGGYTPGQIKGIENRAQTFAEHSLHTTPVFVGDVNNYYHGPTFTKNRVVVSTGDEASPQFMTGIVSLKGGKPVHLKQF